MATKRKKAEKEAPAEKPEVKEAVIAPKAEKEAPAEKPEVKTSAKIVVAPGKSITTMVGVKSAGDIVEAKMFKLGQEAINDLKKKGYLE